jgi:hypothetical protein
METIAYLILTGLTLCWCYFASGRDKRVLFIYIPWLIFICILSYFNFFKNTTALPPRFLVAVLPNVFFIWVLVKKTKLNQLNIITLTSLQIIRIPIELFLYAWYLNKTVPISMTFKGLNFDILMGITALFLTIYLLITKKTPKKLLLGWNVIGLLFIINIVTIAILSAPTPFQQFAFNQPNIAILSFPNTLLPVFLVPVAVLAHVLSIKKLRAS